MEHLWQRHGAKLTNLTAFHSPFVCAVAHASVFPLDRFHSHTHSSRPHNLLHHPPSLLFQTHSCSATLYLFTLSVWACICVCVGCLWSGFMYETVAAGWEQGHVGSGWHQQRYSPDRSPLQKSLLYFSPSLLSFPPLSPPLFTVPIRWTLEHWAPSCFDPWQHLGIQWWIWVLPATSISLFLSHTRPVHILKCPKGDEVWPWQYQNVTTCGVFLSHVHMINDHAGVLCNLLSLTWKVFT